MLLRVAVACRACPVLLVRSRDDERVLPEPGWHARGRLLSDELGLLAHCPGVHRIPHLAWSTSADCLMSAHAGFLRGDGAHAPLCSGCAHGDRRWNPGNVPTRSHTPHHASGRSRGHVYGLQRVVSRTLIPKAPDACSVACVCCAVLAGLSRAAALRQVHLDRH